MEKPVIICVDDEKSVLNALRDEIKFELGNDFSIEIAESGEEALSILNEFLSFGMEIPVIISDQLMPGMKGDELLTEVYRIKPAIRTILLTGQATAESVGNAVNKARLYRFIAKPWDGKDLLMTVREAAKSYFTDAELDARIRTLNDINGSVRALSEVISLNLLAEKVLSLALTHAEAEYGVLMLNAPSGEQFAHIVTAEMKTDASQPVFHRLPVSEAEKAAPPSVIQKILTDKEFFVSERLAKESAFLHDPYVTEAKNQKKNLRSAFAGILEKNNVTVGVLYLENNSKSGAFNPLKLEYLSVLTKQSGISVDNAQLYETLEARVDERTRELNAQKELVEKKNEDITDSILYARRIQSAILPNSNLLYRLFPESFIMYHPKDIVSGDFYWMAEVDNYLYIAVCDCTGHGVPGAFMSVLGNSLLNDAILQEKIPDTDLILNRLHFGIVTNLERSHKGDLLQDGMDISLIRIDRERRHIQYSGANRPLIYMYEGEITEYEPDKMSIGYSVIQDTPANEKHFSKTEFEYKPGANLFHFTDGVTDQFGGPQNRKFSAKSFLALYRCLRISSPREQCEALTAVLWAWRGAGIQTDDMLAISIKLT